VDYACGKRWTACVAALTIIAGVAHAEGVRIDTQVTWTSAGQPEIHLLLENTEDRARTLSVALPRKILCRGGEVPRDHRRSRVFRDLSAFHSELTLGRLEVRGWLHRSFPVGTIIEVKEPCSALYEVRDWTSGELLASGTIEIPEKPPHRQGAEFSGESVSIALVAEKDEDFSGIHVARILVRNREDHGLVLYETDRRLGCEQGTDADWALRHAVLQGEDSGPVWVPRGRWAVFLNSIRVRSGSLSGCVMEVEISALHPIEGIRPVASRSFSLNGVGTIERPNVGR